MYGLLADLILVLHAGFAAFVVLGLFAVFAGAALGAQWAHCRWLRGAHLAAMGVVLGESLAGVVCPLTRWESALRRAAGEGPGYDGSFVGHWVRAVLYYDLPPWVFTFGYIVFFAAMLAALWLVPVRWREKGKSCRGK